jgi:aminoglycoside phosphotransferase (APT) family kinase protein
MLYDTIISRQPVEKGWSGDRKYHAVTESGEDYLLRITEPQRAERFRRCFFRMQEAAALKIPMCLPIELGESAEGTYAIHSWIDGDDAEELIPTLPKEKQYAYGLDAGRILKKLHSLPAPADAEPWTTRFSAKIDRKIAMYESCPLKYENGEAFLEFIAQNRYLLKDRPQAYQHGDYHIGNMMVDRDGKLTVIDFDRDDYGDPWEEFNRIVWCAQASEAFASGMIDGYFNGEVPMEFWNLLALYIASNSLSSLPWAVAYGEREIAVMQQQAAQVLSWYRNMTQVVPTWYRRRK